MTMLPILTDRYVKSAFIFHEIIGWQYIFATFDPVMMQNTYPVHTVFVGVFYWQLYTWDYDILD